MSTKHRCASAGTSASRASSFFSVLILNTAYRHVNTVNILSSQTSISVIYSGGKPPVNRFSHLPPIERVKLHETHLCFLQERRGEERHICELHWAPASRPRPPVKLQSRTANPAQRPKPDESHVRNLSVFGGTQSQHDAQVSDIFALTPKCRLIQ